MELPAACWASRSAPSCCRAVEIHADANREEYARLLELGLRMTFVLAVPAAAALAVIALPLVASLFHYGRFGARCLDDLPGAGGLIASADRHDLGEDPGAGLLCQQT